MKHQSKLTLKQKNLTKIWDFCGNFVLKQNLNFGQKGYFKTGVKSFNKNNEKFYEVYSCRRNVFFAIEEIFSCENLNTEFLFIEKDEYMNWFYIKFKNFSETLLEGI